MKNKPNLPIVGNVAVFVLIFLLAIGLGSIFRGLIASNSQTGQVETVERVYEVKRDTLPLENGGEVSLELVGKERSVFIAYEDLEFISKNKSTFKKFVKKIDALFLRMKK